LSGCPETRDEGSLVRTASTRPEPLWGTKSQPSRHRRGGRGRSAYGQTCRRLLVEPKTRPGPDLPLPSPCLLRASPRPRARSNSEVRRSFGSSSCYNVAAIGREPEKEPSMPVLLRGLPVHDHAQSDTEKGFAHRAKARFVTCTFVRFTRSPFVPITQLRHVAMPHSNAGCWMVLVRLNGRETKSGETRAVFGADGRRFSP
jgi:hypothetical protein